MKVSVIIPVYRKTEYLDKCLESLAKQSQDDFEVIIVDDGSDENSKCKIQNAKLCRQSRACSIQSAQCKIKNLYFIFQSHQGPARARNLGAKKSAGEILVFVDTDMVFEQNFLKDLIKPIEERKTRGTFSKNEYVANWDNVWARCWNYNLDLPVKKRLPDNYPAHAPVFRAILKSEFDKVDGFDPRGYNDDWSLSEKLGYFAKAAPGAFYYHYNPKNLREAFFQAKWVVKRKYKYSLMGDLFALLYFIFPVSLLIGFWKAIKFREPWFLIFKIIFDFAGFLGILEKIFFHKYY